jgi:hypothetical protein
MWHVACGIPESLKHRKGYGKRTTKAATLLAAPRHCCSQLRILSSLGIVKVSCPTCLPPSGPPPTPGTYLPKYLPRSSGQAQIQNEERAPVLVPVSPHPRSLGRSVSPVPIPTSSQPSRVFLASFSLFPSLLSSLPSPRCQPCSLPSALIAPSQDLCDKSGRRHRQFLTWRQPSAETALSPRAT